MTEVKATFQQTQARHLKTIEAWGEKQRKIAGVPIVQMLNYDLVQVLNQVYLKEFLDQQAANH